MADEKGGLPRFFIDAEALVGRRVTSDKGIQSGFPFAKLLEEARTGEAQSNRPRVFFSHSSMESEAELAFLVHLLGQRHLQPVVDFADFEERLENLEVGYHGIRPMMAKLASALEHLPEKDALPAAASPDYDWALAARRLTSVFMQLRAHFDDLDQRLESHVKLLDTLKSVLPGARKRNKATTEAVITVLDAATSVYAEDLTAEQLDVLERAIGMLGSRQLNRDQVVDLDAMLLNAGFETIPVRPANQAGV